jgi:hypothetical protein
MGGGGWGVGFTSTKEMIMLAHNVVFVVYVCVCVCNITGIKNSYYYDVYSSHSFFLLSAEEMMIFSLK